MNEAEAVNISGGVLFGEGAEGVAEVPDVPEAFEFLHFDGYSFLGLYWSSRARAL